MTVFWPRAAVACGALACALFLLAAVAPAGARGKAPRSAGGANPVADLVVAQQLAAIAGERRDALAMTVAAQLLRGVRLEGSGLPEAALPSAEALFDRAEALAANRPDLLPLITDARKAGHRGLIGAIEAQAGTLAPRAARTFRFTFAGDADAAVAVTRPADAGDADADIDLYVADERGAPVCTGESPGLPELCRWTPRRSGAFQVRLENRGSQPAPYLLVVR